MKKLDKSKKKEYNKSDYLLLGVFVLLFIVFVVLLIYTITLKNKAETEKMNISIPIMSDNLSTTVNIDVSERKKDDVIRYNFRVVNYHDRDVNSDDIKYLISLNSPVEAEYTLVKEDKELDIKNGKTKYFKLKTNKREAIKYYLVIKLKEDTKKNQFIDLKVGGELNENS